MTLFGDVMNVMLMHMEGGISGECMHEPWGCHLGFLELNILVT